MGEGPTWRLARQCGVHRGHLDNGFFRRKGLGPRARCCCWVSRKHPTGEGLDLRFGSLAGRGERAAGGRSRDAAPPLPEGTLVTARSSELRTAPDGGAAIGTAAKDVMLTPLARERGWVRVRVEGWVRERDVMPADSLARSAVSAADLRADPLGSRGRIVRWEVEIVAFQVADPLRHDLTPDEPYLLARGPGRENALLYLAIPPSLVAQARALPPLAPVIITARVRTGKSNPTGVPVLDLQQLSRK